MSAKGKLDLAAIERTAFGAAMADLGPFPPPISANYWPKPLGRPYIFEMLRRTYGMAAAEFARATLPIFTLH
jgi:hypothetical protein